MLVRTGAGRRLGRGSLNIGTRVCVAVCRVVSRCVLSIADSGIWGVGGVCWIFPRGVVRESRVGEGWMGWDGDGGMDGPD